jgi:hypothetical protein
VFELFVGFAIAAVVIWVIFQIVKEMPMARQMEGGPIGEDGLTNKERGELAGLKRLESMGRALTPAQQRHKEDLLRRKIN